MTRHAPAILIVDDEADFRDMLHEFLAMCGFTVLEACDAEEGMKAFETGRVDLVIMDLIMPKAWGDATMREMRRIRPDLGIVVITGDSCNAALTNLQKEAGFLSILRKPFLLNDLLGLVHHLLGLDSETGTFINGTSGLGNPATPGPSPADTNSSRRST